MSRLKPYIGRACTRNLVKLKSFRSFVTAFLRMTGAYREVDHHSLAARVIHVPFLK
jgi:hypothetical protein